MSKKCLFCGATLEDEDLFCDECGKKQDQTSIKAEAERKAKEQEQAKKVAEERAREEAERKAREKEETEMRIKAEAEARVRLEAEQKAQEEARRKAQEEAAAKAESKRIEQEKRKEEREKNPVHLAWIALALGIVSWIVLVTVTLVAIPTSIAGIVFGIKGLKSTKKVTSIISLCLNGAIWVFIIGVIISAL